MKDYIIEAYRRFGIMMLILVITVIFCSPMIIGIILGILVNRYWFFLIFGLFITVPMETAVIMRLVDENII